MCTLELLTLVVIFCPPKNELFVTSCRFSASAKWAMSAFTLSFDVNALYRGENTFSADEMVVTRYPRVIQSLQPILDNALKV